MHSSLSCEEKHQDEQIDRSLDLVSIDRSFQGHSSHPYYHSIQCKNSIASLRNYLGGGDRRRRSAVALVGVGVGVGSWRRREAKKTAHNKQVFGYSDKTDPYEVRKAPTFGGKTYKGTRLVHRRRRRRRLVAGTSSGKMVSSVCVRNSEVRVVEFVCDVLLLMRLQKIPRLPKKKSGKRLDAGGDDDGGDRVGVVGEEVKVQKEAPSLVLVACHCYIATVA